MITLLGNSDYVAERRVNCESLLSFDGQGQYASAVNPNITATVDYNKKWTIVYFVSVNMNSVSGLRVLFSCLAYDGTTTNTSGNINDGFVCGVNGRRIYFDFRYKAGGGFRLHSLQADWQGDSLHSVAISWNPDTGQYRIGANGIFLPTTQSGSMDKSVYWKNSTYTLTFFSHYSSATNNVPTQFGYPFAFAHGYVFNDSLQQDNFLLIHRYTGHLATDQLRRACVAHYVPDRDGLTMWEVCPQYNYAKPSALSYSEDSYAGSTNTVFSGDSHLEITIPKFPLGSNKEWYRVKLVPALTESNATTFGIGEVVFTQINDRFNIYKNGTLITQILSVLQGDVIRISRVGSQITVYQNNVQRATYASISSNLFPVYVPLGIDAPTPVISLNSSSINWNNFKGVLIRDGVFVKTNHLLSYPATLVNFTPAQVEGSGQNAYLDFYDKKRENTGILSLRNDRSTQARRFKTAQLPTSFHPVSYTLYVKMRNFTNKSDAFRAFGVDYRSPENIFIGFQNNRITVYHVLSDGSSTLTSYTEVNTPISKDLSDQFYDVFIGFKNGVGAYLDIYSPFGDHVRRFASTTLSIRSASQMYFYLSAPASDSPSAQSNFDIAEFAYYNDHLSLEDQRKVIRAIDQTDTRLLERYYFDNFSGDGKTIAGLNGHDMLAVQDNLGNYQDSELLADSGTWKEKSSQLPPLVNALKLDGTSQYLRTSANFTGAAPNGYSIIFAFALDTNRNFRDSFADFFARIASGSIMRIYGVSNTKNVTIDGLGASIVSPVTANLSAYDLSKLNLLCITNKPDAAGKIRRKISCNGRMLVEAADVNRNYVDLSASTAPLEIAADASQAARRLKGHMAFFAVVQGEPTHKQLLEIWNNSLLANPKASWKNLERQLLPNFNQINDDGAGSYTLTDNSPQNHTIQLQGFTAPNLNPQDPNYSLTEINSLR